MLQFETPKILLFLLVLPIIYIWYNNILKKKKKAAIKFSNLEYLKSAMGDKTGIRRTNYLFYLCLLVLALIIIGFANPTLPLMQTKEGVNVVLVMDVSGSMMAEDYKPNRLEASKKAARVLLKSLKPKDHAGIVIFETGATTAAYLSPYKDRVLDELETIQPREGSTAIGDGLSMGIEMATSIPNRKKVVILLSDGVNNAGIISPMEAVGYARDNNIQVYTIGLGSDEPVILGYDWFGRPQYAELDETTLKYIASETGGKYFKSVNESTLDDIYKNISQDIEREKERTNIKDWFFLGATLVFLIYLYARFGGKRIIQ
ncbi:MAG: VWA domain-containing protein [Vulcanimicrobiota bacterium]